MPVLINKKICDNAPECSGIEACETGALYFDEEKKRLAMTSQNVMDVVNVSVAL